MKRLIPHYPNAMLEWPDGDYCEFSDLHAWGLKHKATVEGMEHESGCYSHKHCGVSGCGHAPWASYHLMHKPLYMHAFEPGRCDCRVGDALREIEELLK